MMRPTEVGVPEAVVRRGREGSRWYNARPSGEDVAAWFKTIALHEGMEHEHYIGGVTLIPAKEKSNEVVGFSDDGLPLIREREDLVFVPYVKVETRVAYFWRYMELHADWEGEIVPVPAAGGEPLGMPPGYFRYTAARPDGKIVNFVACSMRVHVRERNRFDSNLRAVMSPPPGTKAVPTMTRWDVDANALMKAETGAVGRALGMAGMLVVPGSGVATAEDMLELAGPSAGAVAEDAQLPQPEPENLTDEQLRERASALVDILREQDPDALASFQEWARGRNLTLAEAQGAALRGVVRKLETTIEASRAPA
jgi:hypothetical protein